MWADIGRSHQLSLGLVVGVVFKPLKALHLSSLHRHLHGDLFLLNKVFSLTYLGAFLKTIRTVF